MATGAQLQISRTYADMAFTFASPASVLYNKANVKQIDVPSFSGSFGILPNHVPVIAVLKPGVITVHEQDGANKKYFVSSGSVTINDDSSVQILAEEAFPVDQLDAQAVREGAAKAAQDLLSASSEVAKAEAQIALDCYDALQKAVDSH
jgi:F-type H+-transporting ATPase subunit delta